MARPVTADHILFKECIPFFRPPENNVLDIDKQHRDMLTAYLLVDFDFKIGFKLDYFSINPTMKVQFPNAYGAFIMPIELPIWIENIHSHLFTTALSSVLSFAIERPVKSPRDFYFFKGELSENEKLSLGLNFPVLLAGPGSTHSSLSKNEMDRYQDCFREVVSTLYNVPYKRYIELMQAFRLVQLSYLSYRDDFALSYSLLIAAIESIATSAISPNDVKDKNPLEQEWEIAAKEDKTFREAFKAYKAERGKNQYLMRRFLNFILSYCPILSWNELPHPHESLASFIVEHTGEPAEGWSWLTDKRWGDIYPSDLPSDYIEKILKDAYKHRSGFVHKGMSPPHQVPVSSNRYFDLIHDFDYQKRSLKTLIVPNYRLMSFITKRSILEFARECGSI